MSRASAARSERIRIRGEALLVRRVPYADADLVLAFLCQDIGLVSALARSARRSARRFPALEPIHSLRVTIDLRRGAELGTLVEAEITRPRLTLTGDLERMEAAGTALRWVRRASPPHTPEPRVWAETNALLDALDALQPAASPAVLLAESGLRLLAAVGWGLDLERCVVCGRSCAPTAAADIDAARGGLVCRACGGARMRLSAERRGRLLAAAAGMAPVSLQPGDAAPTLALIEEALAAHAGLDA
jgi:DNA repair protein RecO (recombination protein O)